MEHYRFNDNNNSIEFPRYEMPMPWINYLSNGSMHAFVSQAGGGMCWWKSPSIFRLTRYRSYNLPLDSPGVCVYIREADGTFWSLSFRPTESTTDSRSSAHFPGRTQYTARRGDITAKLDLYVAPDFDVLVAEVTLVNSRMSAADLDLFCYVELSLLEWLREVQWGCYVKHQLRTWYDETCDAVSYLYHADGQPQPQRTPLVYLASTAQSKSVSGDRDHFVGPYRSERNPIGVERGDCGGSFIEGGDPGAAMQVGLSVGSGRSERVAFFLGVAPGGLLDLDGAQARMQSDLNALRTLSTLESQRARIDTWWKEHLETLQCSTPEPEISRQVNIWNAVQTFHNARFSRSTSFYASGLRGVGFRDTCQDMIAVAFRKPLHAQDTLSYLLSQQFPDGHAVHTSWPEEGIAPQKTVHSDDHLWLPLLAYAVCAETGDKQYLSKAIPYLPDDSSGTAEQGSVWEHLMAAATFTSQHLGSHGIPLILRSDWNDVIGRFARQGRGESVFAAQQYVVALDRMIEMADWIGALTDREKLILWRDSQIEALTGCSWDGQWWVRGFDDDGKAIGSRCSDFGKIWLNPQSWAVLSGTGDRARLEIALQSASDRLDTDVGLQIFSPSFKTYPDVKDPFSGYAPGCGENGSIFCQANAWAVMAEAIMGNAERAWKYYRQLVPHIALHKMGIERYQGEPYAYASNILGPDNRRFGFANVAQLTGTAAWMEVAVTQYLLGIRPVLAGLAIAPCIPREWDGFSMERIFRGRRMNIAVSNPDHVSTGVVSLKVNGREVGIAGEAVVGFDSMPRQGLVNVEVVMGSTTA